MVTIPGYYVNGQFRFAAHRQTDYPHFETLLAIGEKAI